MFEECSSHDVAVYGGFLSDDSKILQSASGGIATALGEFMLSQGGYVAGVAYSDDLYRAEYIIIHDVSEIGRLRGSKYIDCDKKNIYSDVRALLDAGEKVLFFGLPCVVAALYKFIGERHENLWTCELICHGPTYPKVHYDYITYLEKKYKSKVVDFSTRYKSGAWVPSYLYARFENGREFKKPFAETEYGIGFSMLAKTSCYDCKFKGNRRQADIMLGDFWGAGEKDEFWNKYGVSSVFAETEKGNAFLRSTPGITLFPTTFERAIKRNLMVVSSRKPGDGRDKFAEMLSEKGLIYAVKRIVPLRTRLKRFVKKLLPTSLISFLRGMRGFGNFGNFGKKNG